MHRFSFDQFKLPTSKNVRLIFSKTETVKLQTLPSMLCITDYQWLPLSRIGDPLVKMCSHLILQSSSAIFRLQSDNIKMHAVHDRKGLKDYAMPPMRLINCRDIVTDDDLTHRQTLHKNCFLDLPSSKTNQIVGSCRSMLTPNSVSAVGAANRWLMLAH